VTAGGESGGPLAGIRIIDFTENMAGPFGTMILADQGADVIKVESPAGDALRHRGTGAREMAAYFANLNRGKRSLCLDLRSPRAADVLEPLLDRADVVVTSLRPAAAARLRIDAPSVRATRPQVIHASIVGFGTTGPWAGRPVYDHVIQAASGMAAQQVQDETDRPRLIRHGLVDKSTGHVLAQSVTAALFDRLRTQRGAALSIVMLDVAISLLWPDGMMNHTALEPAVRGAAAAQTFQLTPTADGYISLVALRPRSYQNLVTALRLPLDQDAAPTDILRAARAELKSMTSAEAAELLAEHDVPCSPVVELADVADHPQVIANGTLIEYAHPVIGPIRQPRPVPTFDGVLPGALRGAPLLGADGPQVLGELGLDEAAIGSLISAGVVRVPSGEHPG
jgi:crotonobetainyl-CoA:carnitine CoA-transferase CaiB-like acyl-CoA transferase